MRNLLIALILGIASCAVGRAQAKSIGELRKMFDYDRSLPLDVKEIGVEDRNGVHIHDISYQSPKGGRVTAYLIVPSGQRQKLAGVIFMHARPGNRKNFLDEALSLAQVGAVSLLIDAPFSRAGDSNREFDPTVTKPGADRDIYIQTVIDLRRGVDLLVSRSDVDPKRIGFIGHSYGAHTGAVLAGVEKRIRAYVIMAGAPSLTEFLRTSTLPAIVKTRDALTKEQQENYFNTLAAVDPINYIGHVAPAALFLQFGKTDGYPTEETAKFYAEKASQPKLVKFYDAGHALNDEAKRDRAEWLRERIPEASRPASDQNGISCSTYLITVTVNLGQGSGAVELTRENFVLSDNGIRQDIPFFTRIQPSVPGANDVIYALGYHPPVWLFTGKRRKVRVVVFDATGKKLKAQFSPAEYRATKEFLVGP